MVIGAQILLICTIPGRSLDIFISIEYSAAKTKIMASGPITSWEIDGETVSDFIFFWAPKSLQMVTAAMKLKDAYSLEEKLWPT